jgi:hypothetical protein
MRKSTTDRMNDYDAVMMGVLEPIFVLSVMAVDWRSPGAALTHTATPSQMSALGHDQTSRHVRIMSVLPLKADILSASGTSASGPGPPSRVL